MLRLAIPVDEANRRYEVTVLVKPANKPKDEGAASLGWPKGFFEEFAGSIQDPTFFRHDQGQLEKRLPLE